MTIYRTFFSLRKYVKTSEIILKPYINVHYYEQRFFVIKRLYPYDLKAVISRLLKIRHDLIKSNFVLVFILTSVQVKLKMIDWKLITFYVNFKTVFFSQPIYIKSCNCNSSCDIKVIFNSQLPSLPNSA